jgi:hypothetical protein
MNQSYPSLSQEHASKLIKAAGLIAAVQEDARLFEAINQITTIPLHDLY